MAKEQNSAIEETAKADVPVCGLIMPISATENHDEKHWAAVQTLLHRGIRSAGLTPANVWEGVNDRISKRIVSNIFRQDIVVADISDLNPNVMLELGLRLASKKPTVVVFNKGGRIPFDINDVEAIPYPPDLNILEMESFFEKFSTLLKARLESHRNGTYEPYLSDVVVEVLEPQTKEMSVENLVLERLNELGGRISRIERNTSPSNRTIPRVVDSEPNVENYTYAWVPEGTSDLFKSSLESLSTSYSYINEDGRSYFKIAIPRGSRGHNFRSRLKNRLDTYGGDVGAPDNLVETFDLIG